MPITIKLCRWAYDAEVDIAGVVKYRATTRATTNKMNGAMVPIGRRAQVIADSGEEREVDLEPRVLIPPNNYRRSVCIKKKYA